MSDDAKDEGLRITVVPGLFYVDRDAKTIYALDRKFPPDVGRPERDVLLALLRYALDQYGHTDEAP